MLQTIREKTQGIIATFIMAMIAIPFALWGINSYFEGGSSDAVAEAGDVTISINAYRQALERYRGQVKPDVLDNKEFKELVLRGLVDEDLLVENLRKAGYRASDAMLVQEIRRVPAFQRDGVFDDVLYQAMLRRQGMTALGFEQELRRQTIAGQLRTGLNLAGFASAPEVDALVALQLQRRSFSYVVVTPATFASKIKITPEQVDAYYKEHAESYKTTEQVRLGYVELSATALAAAYTPTEEELKQLYDESGQFSTPAKRRVSHILIELPAAAPGEARTTAKAKIEQVAKELKAGADFAVLAKKYSQDPSSAQKGGDLGEIKSGTLPKELEKAVFALKTGQITAPVQTSYGFHIAKLTSMTAATRKSFKDVRAELEKMIKKRRGDERFLEQAERLRNLAYEQAGSLDPAAKALGLPIKTTDWVTRDGGTGVAADKRVIAAAFSVDVLEGQHNSEPIELDANTLVVVRVAEHRPATLRPLAQVKDKIEAALRQREAATQAQLAAAALRGDAQAGKSLAGLAKQNGAAFHAARVITREKSEQTNPALVAAVFAAPAPSGDNAVFGQATLSDGSYAVFALHKIEAGDPAAADAALKDRLRRQLSSRFGSDFLADYQARLQKKNPVKINRDRL